MSITYHILGSPGRDNALLVLVDSGQGVERLLFDCGDGCLSALSVADIKAIDHLLFSHLHMDHVAGFDTFFRCNFGRDTRPNRIWGPPDTACVMQHRFRGFLWNLHEQMSASWQVVDVHPAELHATRFELREAFAVAHDAGRRPYRRVIIDEATWTIEAVTMDHRTPTLAYIVREKPRQNIDPSRLASLGWRPGPWLKQLKEGATGTVTIDGVNRSLDEMRQALIVETPGDSIAYLTDFLLDDSALEQLADVLRGCRTMVCEGQYRHADLDLARRNFHMTTVLSATLARAAQVGELVLFHLSDRYERSVWGEMLTEAREIFPATRYPVEWNLG